MQKHFLSMGLREFKLQHFCLDHLPERRDDCWANSQTSLHGKISMYVFLHILEMGTWDPAPTQRLPPPYWALCSLCSTLALVYPNPQKTPCSWQNSWQSGCYPTSPLFRLGEGRTRMCFIFWVITLTSLVAMVSQWHLSMEWHLRRQWQPQGAISSWLIST